MDEEPKLSKGDFLRSRAKKHGGELEDLWSREQAQTDFRFELFEDFKILKWLQKMHIRARLAATLLRQKVEDQRAHPHVHAEGAKSSTRSVAVLGAVLSWLKHTVQVALSFLLARKRITAALIFGVMSVVIATNLLGKSDAPLPGEVNGASSGASGAPIIPTVTKDTVAFDLLFPPKKSIENTEVVLVSPPENDPVYAYTDELKKTTIKISQQQLPASLQADSSYSVKELAASFNATDRIQIDAYTVYHGINEKDGVQSLIFAKSDRLVFIVSPQKLDDDTWAAYISRLN